MATSRMISFSRSDAQVLQRVRKVQDIGANGARLILSYPVADLLLSMGDPRQFTATVSMTDWESMVTGARSILKIAACTAQAIVFEHIDVGPDKPSGAARDYFEHLAKQLDKKCQA